MNSVVAVDVDLTLLQADRAWWHWLCSVTDSYPSLVGLHQLNYDLTSYFRERLSEQGLSGYEFWYQEGIYKDVMPLEGAVEAIKAIKELGYTLVPVSKVMGLHGDSKRDIIKELFPDMEECIFTHKTGDKGKYIRVDYVIEDRIEEINTFPLDTKALLLHTTYTQGEQLTRECTLVHSWEAIINYFRGEPL